MEDELVQWLIYIYGKDKEKVKNGNRKNEMINQIDEQVYYLQGEEAEERGIEEGKIKGKLESKKDMARKMLKMNFTNEVISQVTGLSIEKIKKL